MNKLKKLQNGRKKPQGYYFVCLNCIKRQSFTGWSDLDIEKHELAVDYTGAIKTACIQSTVFFGNEMSVFLRQLKGVKKGRDQL